MKPRILQVRTQILKKNDELARGMRAEFAAAGVYVVNLVSSPGTGKTRLLQRTLERLREAGLAVAAIVGDLETDNDARRLAQAGVPVRQIQTHGCCHLEAEMVRSHLDGWDWQALDFLFVENIGNLVCPASWDLGESLRAALLSVTEGEDKPLKYPGLFNTADVAVLTKLDLAEACDFQQHLARENLEAVRPGMPLLETSAKTGHGVEEWIEYLCRRREDFLKSPPKSAPSC